MRFAPAVSFCVVLSLFAGPANAWNATGHKLVAAIAYQHLTPKARSRVDDLLRHHPDYGTLLAKDAPSDPEGRALAAFLNAATWPDVIRGNDPRFYDESRKNSNPTPLLPGFPDMGRHAGWHFIDIGFSPDATPVEPPVVPNALTELRRLLREYRTLPNSPQGLTRLAYDLPWIEHLVGDVHQPLHCTSRFTKELPHGDAGGNRVFVSPGRNLHSLWDNAADSRMAESSEKSGENGTGDKIIVKNSERIAAQHPRPKRLSRNPKQWVEESFNLDKSEVYTFGLENGSREHPVALPAGYEENARRVAEVRIAWAGYRLAEVLNGSVK